jgi:UDP-N-acetylmuramate dehydrogenase
MFNQFPNLKTGEPLSKHCWYALGGPADYFIEVTDIDEIPKLISEAKENSIPYIIIGGGSNTVFHDEGLRGLVIKITADSLEFESGACRVVADAGVSMMRLVKESMERELTGLESLFGLPGTVGGAVFGNAEAHGTAIGGFLESATLLDNNGNLKEVDKDYFQFSYRHSKLHSTGETILKVTLKLNQITEEDLENEELQVLRNKAEEALNFRKDHQPTGRNNGSFFKNPKGDYAGRLIDVAGLKGAKIGGAYISEKHGNFFMNDGTATTSDLIELRNLAKSTVKEKFDITLEEEVRIVMPNGTYLNDEN